MFYDSGQINGNKLRTFSLYKIEIQKETNVKFPITRDHCHILAMVRCGNLPLHIARPKIPVDQRTCIHCNDTVEDELHFLIDCPFYDDIRRKLFKKAYQCNSDF